MKRSRLAKARFQREDVQRYTVPQRVFETVLRCLDEPLQSAVVASAAEEHEEDTEHQQTPAGSLPLRDPEQVKAREERENGGHSSPVRRH
jgi:hypothetical protein